jgi:hypothetical protein
LIPEHRGDYVPHPLRIAAAVTGATLANLPLILGLVVSCGEPPYPTAFCNDEGSTFAPWYVLVLVPPVLVLASALAARGLHRPAIFEVVWITSVCAGLLALPLAGLIA